MLKEVKRTTILSVRKDGKVAMVGDGQVTFGETVIKKSAVKIRKLYKGKVLVGFAGAVADAMALLERFEGKLEKYSGDLLKASVDLAKDWRTDKYLRRLNAMLLASNAERTLIIGGTGDVIEPEMSIAAIGSGAPYAVAAARALIENTSLSAKEIALKSMEIAADICIYTNHNFSIEELE